MCIKSKKKECSMIEELFWCIEAGGIPLALTKANVGLQSKA